MILPANFCPADYPSIRAISTFVVHTKYPQGLTTPVIRSTVAGKQALQLPSAPAAQAVVLTGFSLCAAKTANLTELYKHMTNSTELHSSAPYSR